METTHIEKIINEWIGPEKRRDKYYFPDQITCIQDDGYNRALEELRIRVSALAVKITNSLND